MSSHKKYVKELKPITFITFDVDTTWDSGSGELIYSNEIIDESENGAPLNAILHSEYDVNRPSYKMGQPSMIENQPTDNYSIVLGQYEYDTMNDFEFSKSYVEISYEERIKLDKSFTVSFLFNKARDDRQVLGQYIWNVALAQYLPANGPNGYNYSTMIRTLVKKGDKIGLYVVMPTVGYEYLTVTFPNNNASIQVANVPGGIFNKDVLIVMSHDYIEMDDGRYYTVSKLYWNCRVLYEYTSAPVFGDYDGGNTSPFEFGGNNLPFDYNSLNDRSSSQLRLDQIAIFDYCLQDFQIGNLYKKVYMYETIIKNGYPTLYYRFNEISAATQFLDTISNMSYTRLSYVGSNTQVIKEKPGVHGAYGATSVMVQNRGMLYCKPYISGSGFGSFFNPSSDFTIEFFASFNSNNRGVILSIQDDNVPFRGICLFANSRDNVEKGGSIQLSVTDSTYAQTEEKDARGVDIIYNDGVVRHYAIRRYNNYVELWINSVLINKIYLPAGTMTSGLNQLYMFGLMPGNMSVNGTIQHFALYTRALSEMELKIRASYMVRYSIQGRVTVQGIGAPLLFRVYSFNNGQLLMTDKSNFDGQYNLTIPSDDYINVVVMDPADTNIRPRIIGPTLPDEYQDLPYEI